MGSGPAPGAGAQIRFYLDNGHVRFAGPEICKFTLTLYKTRSGLGTDRAIIHHNHIAICTYNIVVQVKLENQDFLEAHCNFKYNHKFL